MLAAFTCDTPRAPIALVAPLVPITAPRAPIVLVAPLVPITAPIAQPLAQLRTALGWARWAFTTEPTARPGCMRLPPVVPTTPVAARAATPAVAPVAPVAALIPKGR
jgi:hypothetical protein